MARSNSADVMKHWEVLIQDAYDSGGRVNTRKNATRSAIKTIIELTGSTRVAVLDYANTTAQQRRKQNGLDEIESNDDYKENYGDNGEGSETENVGKKKKGKKSGDDSFDWLDPDYQGQSDQSGESDQSKEMTQQDENALVLSGGDEQDYETVVRLAQQLGLKVNEHHCNPAMTPPDRKHEDKNLTPFKRVKAVCKAGITPYVWGPAGSGKSYLAEKVAESLGVPFYSLEFGDASTELDVTGYVNATGLVETPYTRAYEHGGLVLGNEVDNTSSRVLKALNAIIEARVGQPMVLPDGRIIHRHKDFHMVLTANTNGRGAMQGYESAEVIDISTLTRCAFIQLNYSDAHEQMLSGDEHQYLASTVWRLRRVVDELGIDYVVTPRSIVQGRKLIEAGIPWHEVYDMVFLRWLDADDRKAVQTRMQQT